MVIYKLNDHRVSFYRGIESDTPVFGGGADAARIEPRDIKAVLRYLRSRIRDHFGALETVTDFKRKDAVAKAESNPLPPEPPAPEQLMISDLGAPT